VKNGMLWDELKIKFCLNKEELQKIVSAIWFGCLEGGDIMLKEEKT
jgi:hypothetical protein